MVTWTSQALMSSVKCLKRGAHTPLAISDFQSHKPVSLQRTWQCHRHSNCTPVPTLQPPPTLTQLHTPQ